MTYAIPRVTLAARHGEDWLSVSYSLGRAVCAAFEHEAEEACVVAAQAVLSVPPAHRTAILRARAQDVIYHLAPDQQRGPLAEQLNEVFAGILPGR